MNAESTERAVREALDSLRQYLSDSIPPLSAAGPISLLLEQPAPLAASEIQAWIAAQYRSGGEKASVGDYIFHALKRLHDLGQLGLIQAAKLADYLERLKPLVLGFCPVDERSSLQRSLTCLDDAEPCLVPAVSIIHRPVRGTEIPSSGFGGPAGPDVSGLSETARRELRLSMLLDRLQQEGPTLAQTQAAWIVQLSRVLAAAAMNARSGPELQHILGSISPSGTASGTDQVFRHLSRSLPGWLLPIQPEAGDGSITPEQNAVLAAMRQLVRLAENPDEGGRRFRQMVQAAIEEFNSGSLARAASILELASDMIARSEVDAATASNIRSEAHELLDFKRMREYAEKPEKHHLLSRALRFFEGFSPQAVLEMLRLEPRRDRRRIFLSLLETHGEAGRAAALERLHAVAADPESAAQWYFPRNLICLLNRIPRPDDSILQNEIALVASFLRTSSPLPLVREAVACLGETKHEKAEQVLGSFLREAEAELERPDMPKEDSARLRSVLDRVVATLARFGTPTANQIVIDHGLKRKEVLGDTAGRISYLSGHDLSADEASVKRLVDALIDRIPLKLLGIQFQKDISAPLHLIEALSATPAPAVRQALERIRNRFPDHELGRAASKALQSVASGSEPAPVPPEKLQGDLELFGLPDLLRQLIRSQLTGILTIQDRQGNVSATMTLRAGRLQDCESGPLKGKAAIEQLLVDPVPGTFVFLGRRDRLARGQPGAEGDQDLGPLIIEGIRLHDEVQQARALVPDGCYLKATGTEPVMRPDEEDPALFQQVWNRIGSGATPEECEAGLEPQTYRARLLLARWVDDLVLTVV